MQTTILVLWPGSHFDIFEFACCVKSGPTETKAALEFSVNTLNVSLYLISDSVSSFK